MAGISTKTYCTDRDLSDVYPSISGFDLKTRLYSWESLGNNVYISNNTGLVTQLFIDGAEQAVAATGGDNSVATSTATVLDNVDDEDTTAYSTVDVDSATGIRVGDIIIIALLGVTEHMLVTAISSNTLTVKRGVNGTDVPAGPFNVDSVVQVYISLTEAHSFHYDSSLNAVLLYSTTDPNNLIVESGDDWTNIKKRFREKASRLVESRVDAKLAKDIWFDREKNYPDVIVRACALQTVILLISANNPTSDILEPFKAEYDEIITGINNGTIVLPSMRTKDSSEGTIRVVSINSASDLIPVELIGNYYGSTGMGYELLKVFIDTGEQGYIGAAKFTVHGKSSTKLKDSSEVLVDSEIIDGDYQYLGVGDLYIRWGGDDVANAFAYANDEYEIELYARSLGTSTAKNYGTIHLTRR